MSDFRVHPNSTAARKWRRTSWTTTTTAKEWQARQRQPKPTRNLWALAATARRAGDGARADALRRAAARAGSTEVYCR
jgi:hypothetical protein